MSIYLHGPLSVQFSRIESIVLDEIVQSEALYRTIAQSVAYVYGMGVAGDVAEFGTMSGRSGAAIAAAMAYLNVQYTDDPRGRKRAAFFDSFVGLPEPRFDIDKDSPHVTSRVWGQGACKGFSEDEFRKLITKYMPPDDFDVFAGWFRDTVPTVTDRKFAMLHVDGDLYESAIDVLDPLFHAQAISPGAIVLFDDWSCNNADPMRGERRAWGEVCQRYRVQASSLGAYGVASHRFIVHAYKG